MAITVEMIEKKEFKIKMRGFDQEEVNEFLDEICDEMIAMQDQIANLQAQLRTQSILQPAPFTSVPAPAPTRRVPVAEPQEPVSAPAPAPNRVEPAESANRLLQKAQEVYEQMVGDARKEAEGIVSGARAKAESDIEDLERKKEEINEQIRLLKGAARDYRTRFQRLMEDQAHVLNSENMLFSDDDMD